MCSRSYSENDSKLVLQRLRETLPSVVMGVKSKGINGDINGDINEDINGSRTSINSTSSDNGGGKPLKSCMNQQQLNSANNPRQQQRPDTTEREPLRKARSVYFADTIGKPLKSVKTVMSEEESFALHMSMLSLKNDK